MPDPIKTDDIYSNILACVDYDGPHSWLADSPNLTAVDSVHMKATFTATTSGKVLVRLTGFIHVDSGCDMKFGLIDDANESQVGPIRIVAGGNQDYWQGMVSVALIVRNLVPGQSYTYKWGYASNIEAGFHVSAVDGYPPAVMEIIALP